LPAPQATSRHRRSANSHADSHERWPDEVRDPELHRELTESRLERAIGVVYRPETERASHYFAARVSPQFDEYIWFDETTATTPLVAGAHAPGLAEGHPFATVDM